MANHATARSTLKRGNRHAPLAAAPPPPHLANVPEKGDSVVARAIAMLQAVMPFRDGATLSAIEAAHRADGAGGTRTMVIAMMLTGMDLTGSPSRELLALERELHSAVARQCDDEMPEAAWYQDAMRWIESQRAAINGHRSH